ncbi:MAG: hypothetical protein IKZ84_02330, partial [Victivallales bacterium]|nr:hypothetical protein [Victivallales bacterium]
GGANGEAVALKLAVGLAAEEKAGNLLDGLREVVCSGGFETLSNLEGVHGGWTVETGGQPEMWATLLAMECLLEWTCRLTCAVVAGSGLRNVY